MGTLGREDGQRSVIDDIPPPSQARSIIDDIPPPPPPRDATFGDVIKSPLRGALIGTGSLLQAPAELIAQALNASTGSTLRTVNPGQALADAVIPLSRGGQMARAESLPTGDITKPETLRLPERPTLGGLAVNVGEGAGQLVGPGSILGRAGATLASRAAGAGLKQVATAAPAATEIAGFTGMSMAQQAEQVREALADPKMQDALRQSQSYRDSVARGASDGDALDQAIAVAARGAFLGGAPAGSAEGLLAHLVMSRLKTPVKTVPASALGRVGKATKATVAGAASEGLQEVGEDVGGALGANIALGGQVLDPTANTAQSFAGGALAGGPIGAVAHIARPVATPNEPPPNEPPAGPISRAATVAKASVVAAAPSVEQGPQSVTQPDAERSQSFDSLDTSLVSIAARLSDPQLLTELRKDERFGNQSVSDLLYSWGIARNPNIDSSTRARAANGILEFINTFDQRPNFVNRPDGPGTAVALSGGPLERTEAGGQQVAPFQAGRTIDGESSLVTDQVALPRQALGGPTRKLLPLTQTAAAQRVAQMRLLGKPAQVVPHPSVPNKFAVVPFHKGNINEVKQVSEQRGSGQGSNVGTGGRNSGDNTSLETNGRRDSGDAGTPARGNEPPVPVGVAGGPKRALKQKRPSRSIDLLGAIRRRGGISSSFVLDLSGEDMKEANRRWPFLFRKRGRQLDELASVLAHEDRFDIDVYTDKDNGGINQLSEMIRRALSGERVVPIGGVEQDLQAEADEIHRDTVKRKAKRFDVKTRSRNFTDVEQDVLRIERQRHERAVELLDERSARAYDAAYDALSLLIGGEEADSTTEQERNRELPVRDQIRSATRTMRERIARIKEWRESNQDEELDAIFGPSATKDGPSEASARQTLSGRAGEGVEPGVGKTGAGESREPLRLEQQTERELAEKAEREKAASEEKGAITKEQADKELAAVPFSLTQQSQPKASAVTGGQGGFFTPDGRVSEVAQTQPDAGANKPASPTRNDKPEPASGKTEAGQSRVGGPDISIENQEGSVRDDANEATERKLGERATETIKAIARANPFGEFSEVRSKALAEVKTVTGKSWTDLPVSRGSMMSDPLANAISDGQYQGIKDYLGSIPVSINEATIPAQIANSAFSGTSFSPERRGESARRGYVVEMVELWRFFEQDYQKASKEDQERFVSAFDDIAEKYGALTVAYLSAHSRVMSTMITGGSKFPTARNRKRSDTADRRLSEAVEYLKKSRSRLGKALLGPIDRSTNAELEQARAKLQAREAQQERMKAINAAHKRYLKDHDTLDKSDLSDNDKEVVRRYKQEYSWEPHPFAPFELQNNQAEIRRMRARINDLEGRIESAERQGAEEDASEGPTYEGVKIERNTSINRVQIHFDEKPSEAVRADLKAASFRWSPRETAWQRPLTDAAVGAAERVVGKHFSKSEQVKEDGDPEASFSRQDSRGQRQKTIPESALRSVVADLTGKWENAPPIEIVSSLDDQRVPDSVREEIARQGAQGAQGDVSAFWHKGRVFLVADSISSRAHAIELVMHETLGHQGLKGVFGKDLEKVLRRIATVRVTEMRAKAREYGLDLDKDTDRLYAAEEVLADMAQTYPEIGFVKQAIAAIKSFLRRIGLLRADRMSNDEIIREYILPARRFVERGRTDPRRGDDGANVDTQFSRSIRLDNGDVVLRNPTREQAENLAGRSEFKELRGLTDTESGDVYVWDAGKSVHSEVANELGLSNPERFSMLAADIGDAPVGTFSGEEGFRELRGRKGRGGIEVEEVAMFSRSAAAVTSPIFRQSREIFADLTDTVKGFNWRDKTFHTQLHKARKHAGFARVFDMTQQFIDTISATALRASELAPDVLPDITRPGIAWEGLIKGRHAAKDIDAISDVLFSDDLKDPASHEFTEEELAAKGKTQDQIRIYKQVRAAVRESLDHYAAAEAWRLTQGVTHGLRDQVMRSPRNARAVIGEALDSEIGYRLELEEAAREKFKEDRALVEQWKKTALESADSDKERSDIERQAESRISKAKEPLDRAVREKEEAKDLKRSAMEIFDRSDQLKQRGYMPRMRFGRYTVDAIVPETRPDGSVVLDKRGRPVPAKDENGEPVRLFFSMYESEAAANRAARRLGEAYKGQEAIIIKGLVSEEDYKQFRGVSPETVAMFADIIGRHAPNEEAAAALKAARDEYIRLATSNRSAMRRMLKRKDIAGYSEDVSRVLASFLTSNGRAAATAYWSGDMDKAVDVIAEADVRDDARKLANYTRNPEDDSHGVRSLMFFMFLGGSPAAALVNMTQPVMMTFPALARFGGAAKAARMVSRAALDYASRKQKDYDEDLQNAIKRAEHAGIVSPQEIHHLYNESIRNGIISRLPTNFSHRAKSALTLWGFMFSAAESVNRHLSFVAAYRMAKEDAKLGDPYEFAVRLTEETQGIYNPANRPNWSRGIAGAAAFTFRQYSIAYLELLKRMWKSGPEGKRAAGLMLGMLVLASGLQGVGGDDIDDLVDTVGQFFGFGTNFARTKRKWAADLLGKEFGNFAMYGASAYLPIDIQSRLGLNNILPATGLLKRSEENKAGQVLEIFGPPGSVAKAALEGFDAAAQGRYGDTAIALMPKAVRDGFKAADMLATGTYRDSKGYKVADVDSADAFWKAIGLHPASIGFRQRATSTVRQDIALVRDVQDGILRRWVNGILTHDEEAVRDAKRDLQEWNRRNPRLRITLAPRQLQSRLQSAREEQAGRVVKTAPRGVRGALLEDLAT